MSTPKPEQKRLRALAAIEKAARREGFQTLAGIDEAGRGPLAGPVVAAACCIPPGLYFPGINDSKQLTPDQRQTLFEKLIHHKRVTHGIGIISHEMIDRINIYQATIQAMLQAIANLPNAPDLLLVDGLSLPHTIPSRRIVQGDALVHAIAAASIIAKVTRDRLMVDYHQQWPHYGFDQHKGYATERHLAALEAHGPCPIHRRSFAPLKEKGPEQLDLFD